MRPRVGVVGMAYGGYNLGEELGPAKLRQMTGRLAGSPVETVAAKTFVLTEADARNAGEELARADVDCILAVITTFVPDYFIVELLAKCDKPVYLWAVEREMQCISIVCGPLITATLFNLGKPCRLAGADITDAATMDDVLVFARAAMLARALRTLRVGHCGDKCPIMFSMAADEYALTRTFGTTVVNIPMADFLQRADRVGAADAAACWSEIKAGVGSVTAADTDGLLSARYYLAARNMAAELGLHALSLNCFPHLKSKVCLAVARMNDDGIAAACEGDLNSTILMHLLRGITGGAAFNGDWLRMYPECGDVLFSHCGAGAFSLAAGPRNVCLRCSIETRDGLAVCYATRMDGPVTLLNLMAGNGALRLAALAGKGVATDLQYEGTPLRVHFEEKVRGILDGIVRCGAGHHWNGAPGHWIRELALLCEWRGVIFNHIAK